MKKISIFFSSLLLIASCVIVSCNNDDPLDPQVQNATQKFGTVEKLPLGAISSKEYEASIQNKLKGARVMAYTEHGPFTTGASGNVEIPGPDGNGNVWKMALSGFPGIPTAIYFCRYYEHSIMITLPAGAYLLPPSLSSTNIGYQGSAPPNPVGPGTATGISYVHFPATNQYKFTTYTLLPKYAQNGSDMNPGNVRLPSNFTSTTFSYKYFTL
jgi:hypothetical protein